MNIFFLDLNTKLCAMYHVDRHVLKMLIEYVQLLSSVHHMTNSKYIPPYKLTHKNHPSAIWCRESLSNYIWLCNLTIDLAKEYTYRYGKIHTCEKYAYDLLENLPSLEDKGFTTPKLAMPDSYKDEREPVDSYRTYYLYDKQHLYAWKKRNIPKWIEEFKNMFE